MSFRDNLQYLRSQRNMTQEQLAMLLGVTRQAISKWESEKAYPEMDKLLMVCDLFGCTLDDLVLGDVRQPGKAVAGSVDASGGTGASNSTSAGSGTGVGSGAGTGVKGAVATGGGVAASGSKAPVDGTAMTSSSMTSFGETSFSASSPIHGSVSSVNGVHGGPAGFHASDVRDDARDGAGRSGGDRSKAISGATPSVTDTTNAGSANTYKTKESPAVMNGDTTAADSGRASASVGPTTADSAPAGSAGAAAGATTNPVTATSATAAPQATSASSSAASAGAKDVTGYDAQARAYAWRLALGVFFMIAGVAVGTQFSAKSSSLNDMLTLIPILIGFVIGLPLLMWAHQGRKEFRGLHPYVEDFYTLQQRHHVSTVFTICVVAGFVAIGAGLCLNLFGEYVGASDDGGWSVSGMLILFALGVALFVYGDMRRSALKIDRYNRRNEERERVGGLYRKASFGDGTDGVNGVGPNGSNGPGGPDGLDPNRGETMFYRRFTGAVSGVIMMVATLIGFLMLFLGTPTSMGPGFFGFPFWLAWPVGGILCAIAGGVVHMVQVANERRE